MLLEKYFFFTVTSHLAKKTLSIQLKSSLYLPDLLFFFCITNIYFNFEHSKYMKLYILLAYSLGIPPPSLSIFRSLCNIDTFTSRILLLLLLLLLLPIERVHCCGHLVLYNCATSFKFRSSKNDKKKHFSSSSRALLL